MRQFFRQNIISHVLRPSRYPYLFNPFLWNYLEKMFRNKPHPFGKLKQNIEDLILNGGRRWARLLFTAKLYASTVGEKSISMILDHQSLQIYKNHFFEVKRKSVQKYYSYPWPTPQNRTLQTDIQCWTTMDGIASCSKIIRQFFRETIISLVCIHLSGQNDVLQFFGVIQNKKHSDINLVQLTNSNKRKITLFNPFLWSYSREKLK